MTNALNKIKFSFILVGKNIQCSKHELFRAFITLYTNTTNPTNEIRQDHARTQV